MARGATQARRKPAPEPPKRKKSAPAWEDQLFFSRLRHHAKLIFLLLAIVFAVSFVFLGVGSGSNGITDALQSFFGRSTGSSLGSQIHSKQQALARHPKDVNLYLDLAGTYQADQQEAKALATLQKAHTIAPRNVDVLNRIAALYGSQAGRAADEYTATATSLSLQDVQSPGVYASSALGQALTSDPYTAALRTQLNDAYTKATGAYGKVAAIYQQAAQYSKGTANEPNELLQWASASRNANDVQGALTAYKRFLKVAPDNPNAPAVKQTIAQLLASGSQPQR